MLQSPDLPSRAASQEPGSAPADLAALCEALFVGPLSFYAGSLAFSDHSDAVAASALGDKAFFDDLVGRFARDHGDADRQAVTSFWSQTYFARLTIAATSLCLSAGGPLPLDFAGLKIRFCPRTGTPLCFHLPCITEARPVEALVKAIYDDQVAPTVACLKRHSGLSIRLLWENAGGYGLWILGEIARTRPEWAVMAERLLDDGTWPRAACGLLPHMKCAAREARPCSRRVCCLRYRLPGFGRCAEICPLSDGPETAARRTPRAR